MYWVSCLGRSIQLLCFFFFLIYIHSIDSVSIYYDCNKFSNSVVLERQEGELSFPGESQGADLSRGNFHSNILESLTIFFWYFCLFTFFHSWTLLLVTKKSKCYYHFQWWNILTEEDRRILMDPNGNIGMKYHKFKEHFRKFFLSWFFELHAGFMSS